MSINTYIDPLASCTAIGFFNWGISNFYTSISTRDPSQKSSELKRGYLKLAIAVAVYAVNMGIGSDTSLASDITIFGITTGIISLTGAIKEIYSGSRPPYAKEPYIKAALKLGLVIAVLTGLNLSVILRYSENCICLQP